MSSEHKERKLSAADELFVRESDPKEWPTLALAARFGVSDSYIRRIRREGRQERREIARDVLEKRVQAEMPNALEDLAEARKYAKEDYLGDRNPATLRAWLATVTETLDRLGLEKDDDPLKDVPDAQVIEELTQRGVVVRH